MVAAPYSVYGSGPVTRLCWARRIVPLTETTPMKLCRALIRNFKGIKTLDIDFRDTVWYGARSYLRGW